LNESEAARRGIDCDVYRLAMKEVDRAVLEGEDEGFAKVLAEKGKGRILGATLVCERAGELIHEFVIAMKHGLGLSELSAITHVYPTASELARKLGDRYNRTRLTPFAKRAFGWLCEKGRSE
jgi:pyruvate/2-oxoglutarate dehydrogenase complex dihydrolipoamide dehydrogenase (E3) component